MGIKYEKFILYITVVFLLLYSCSPKPNVEPIIKEEKPIVKPEIMENHDIPDYLLPKERTSFDIRQTVRARQGGLEYCYNNMVKIVGKKSGKVNILFSITVNGSVKDIKIVESDFKSAKFDDCLINSIVKWKFDSISSNGEQVTVEFPFSFGS